MKGIGIPKIFDFEDLVGRTLKIKEFADSDDYKLVVAIDQFSGEIFVIKETYIAKEV